MKRNVQGIRDTDMGIDELNTVSERKIKYCCVDKIIDQCVSVGCNYMQVLFK